MIFKIELFNFKSYKYTHIIGPFDRFSCIVGPNGSGKSNILDALCFAFTITTNNLRAENLDDLINKESNQMSVIIHFQKLKDNKSIESIDLENLQITNNEDIITLKRELSRKQTSVFYINNKKLSMHEYIEYLAILNVFPKAKNFLIFQGEIDQISHKSSIDLTKLIEEISGSIIYKKEYLEKQEEMNKNFLDCQNLLDKKKEIFSKLKSVKENKENLKKFKQKIKKKEEIHSKLKLVEIKNKLNNIREKEILVEKKFKQKEVLEVEIKEMQRDRNEINLIQKECFLIEDKIEELDEKIKKEEKREFQEDNLKDDIKKKEIVVNDLILEIKTKKTRIESCKTEINILQKNFFEIKKGYENDNKFYVDDKIKEQFNFLEETFKKEAFEEIENINNLNYKVKPQKEKIKQHTKNINEITNKLELYKKEEYNKNYLINDILKIINTNNNIINLMVDKKKEGFQKFNLINEEELNLNREFGMILKNIMSHKSFVKEDERKNKIHEAIEVLKSNFSGVYGRFIDLISLTQKKYELALSVLIGNYDQAVIVDNEKTAIECIKYIKLKKIGRVTFLPLNSLKVKQINRCSSDKIYAIDTIVFDDLYKKAILFVLGNSIVCEDFMKAKNIFDLENLNEKIVTLDGTLFHQNGNITAGKIDSKFTEKNLSLLLKRKNEILERLKEIKNLKSQFHHIEIANEKIKEIDNENEKLNKKIKEEGDKKDFLSKLIKNLEEQIINLENEKNDLLNEIFEFDKNKQNFEIRKKKKEDEIFYNFIYKKNLSEFREFLKDRNIFLSKKEAEFYELKDNYEFEIKNLFENINELEENVKTQNLNLIELKNKANKQNNKIELLKFKNLEIEKLDLIKEKFCHKRKELENQNESLNKKINQINAIGKEIIILEKNILRLKEENFELIKLMQLEEIKIPFINKKMQIDNLDDQSKINSEKNYLETENSSKNKDFNLLNIEDEDISMDSYESSKENELNVIKKVDKNYLNLIDMDQIDFSNLKDINIYIKEFKEICKDLEENIPVGQFKEINYQGDYAKISFEYDEARKDALKSKEIFNNIKEKRSEMFMQCFEKINENIGLIYRDLTRTEESEGNAYLLLENNVEAYKEGTKYFIMPPKKRYREINMLSGGEKTLAAFALLLSFHFYKPSSFYIFDELDSALDKTNVKRITDFILKSKIQFIAITLKPDFFQYADGLVGIYKLKEKSKVLTLKL